MNPITLLKHMSRDNKLFIVTIVLLCYYNYYVIAR